MSWHVRILQSSCNIIIIIIVAILTFHSLQSDNSTEVFPNLNMYSKTVMLCNVVIACIKALCLSKNSGSDSLSSGAAATITFAVTFIITLTATAIVTFVVTYICCVKKQYESPNNNQLQSPQEEKVLYEQVSLPSHTVTKNDVELQPNPAYGTSDKVIMDTNPAYESCK